MWRKMFNESDLNDLNARQLRGLFLLETGFPLIKSNAKQFVPNIGDLRCIYSIRAVCRAVLAQKARQQQEQVKVETAQEMARLRERQEYESRLAAQTDLLESLKQRVRELESEVQEYELKREEYMQQEEEPVELEPEDYLASYVSEVEEELAQPVLVAAIQSQLDQGEEYSAVYRKFARAFHPDSSKLADTTKATAAFQLLGRLADEVEEQLASPTSSQEESITDEYIEEPECTEEAERREEEWMATHYPDKGYRDENGRWQITDIPF